MEAGQRIELKISELKPAPYNPRHIDDDRLEGLANAIDEFGVVQDVVVNIRDGKMRIVGGHQRVKAAKKLGRKAIECVLVDLDDIKERALNLTLNNPHIAGNFTADIDELLNEIKTVDFAMYESVGLDSLEDDAQMLLDRAAQSEEAEQDETPLEPGNPVTVDGAIWHAGPHRLICADSTDPKTYEQLLEGEKAHLCVTSPPYWIGKSYERETTWEEVQDFIASVSTNIADNVDGSGRIVINTMATHCAHLFKESQVRLLADDWQRCLGGRDWLLRYIRIWSKLGEFPFVAPQRDMIDSYWEFILYFYNPKHKYRGRIRVEKKYDWILKGVWDFPGDRSAGGTHCAAFPVELPWRVIILHTHAGETVLEPFSGYGTTLIACEQTERVFRGIEIGRTYSDVTVQRWCNFTGQLAEMFVDGKKAAELEPNATAQ